MNRYLLDTNHLSPTLTGTCRWNRKIDIALKAGDRFGLCLPVLCEYHAGIRLGRRYQRNLVRLNAALLIFRLWPIDEGTALEFAEVYRELRSAGHVMSQFDLLIAALARQGRLILLTADQDFRPVTGLHVESWL